MSISDEIFDSFFTKISEDDDVPNGLAETLKNLTQETTDITEEQVINLISKGCNKRDKD